MGEQVRGVSEAAALTDEDGSIGLYLARQRRLRDISVDDLAELTKIPRRSIERLEAGAFDHSKDGFSRGFVRTVAEALGLDPEEAVMRLLGEPPEPDEAARLDGFRAGRWVLLLAGFSVLIATLLAATWLIRGFASPQASIDLPVVYRRDAVRALAESEARAAAAIENEVAERTDVSGP